MKSKTVPIFAPFLPTCGDPKMTGTSYIFHASIIDSGESLRRRFRFAASTQRCCKNPYISRLRLFSSPDAMNLKLATIGEFSLPFVFEKVAYTSG